MNRTEIINKIREIFSMTQEKFELYKNTEGVEFRIEALELENEVYIITPEGELPAEDGEIVLEDGTKVKVSGGKIKDLMIEDKVEEEVVEEETMEEDEEKVEEVVEEETMEDHEDKEEKEETEMAEATLIDGTIVEVDGELVVGAKIYVKTEEGRQPAPDADHETADGLVVSTEDGVITEIKEKEVEEEVKVEEVMETFMGALTSLKEEIATLRKENEALNNKFSEFKAEPAGEKIYDRKGAYVSSKMSSQADKLERLAALRSK